MENLIIFGAIVVAASAAVVIVLRRRMVAPPSGPHIALEPGWQFYGKPTALEPPGTVFRIDRNKHRFIVTTLKVTPTIGEEEFGQHHREAQVSTGVLARMLGLASVAATAGKVERLTLQLGEVTREVLSDQDIDSAPLDWTWRRDSDYYTIRDVRSAKRITYLLDQATTAEFGGKVTLKTAVEAEGSVFAEEKSGLFAIRRRFDRPMRVMFLAEELRPLPLKVGGPMGVDANEREIDMESEDILGRPTRHRVTTEVERRQVTHPLEWVEEGVEPEVVPKEDEEEAER